jgi:hypothetical protein
VLLEVGTKAAGEDRRPQSLATWLFGGQVIVYADAMSAALASRGISVAAADMPTQDSVDADVQSLRDWLSSLDGDTRGAIDQVTGENAVKAGLADPSVGIVSAIGPILAAFDAAPESISISAATDTIAAASSEAAAADPPVA